MNTPPKIIYLQDVDYQEEITWCQDKINENDAEYILKSEYDSETQKLKGQMAYLQKENEKLSKLLKEIFEKCDDRRILELFDDHKEGMK